jgi:DNA adenine methylase
VNKNGKFNVPIGTKTKVILPTDDFKSFSQLLKNEVEFSNQSFTNTLQQVQKDDFVYIDPPYTVNHDKNGFLKYNESIFAWKDQIQLRNEIENIALQGAKIIISQSNHQSIHDLYKGFGKNIVLNRHSVLSAKREFRKNVQELIISINC